MNAYDLDNTIYDGESGFDFYMFVLRENPRLLRYGKVVIEVMTKYKLGRLSREEMIAIFETYALAVLNDIPDLKDTVNRFWDTHMHKIKSFYYKLCRPDDVLITASFSFFINELLRRLKIQNCICSEMNLETGRITQLCYHENKATLFREHYPDVVLHRYFGDSKMDMPILKMAETGYVVKGDRIVHVMKKEKGELLCLSPKK